MAAMLRPTWAARPEPAAAAGCGKEPWRERTGAGAEVKAGMRKRGPSGIGASEGGRGDGLRQGRRGVLGEGRLRQAGGVRGGEAAAGGWD